MSETKACPYTALGVPKDATPAAIKTAYRKLALKCHPDKLITVTDEALKQEKQEEFHKIHTAYELIGDEEKRAKYDAEVRLELLRKEALARGGSKTDVKTARYETRTAAPAGATFSAKGPSRYEERRPAYEERKPASRYEEDRYFEERAHRKYDAYESAPRSSRTVRPEDKKDKDKEPLRTKTSSDRTRSERVKTRDRDERRERSSKFVYGEGEGGSSSDEKARYEAQYKRRSDDARRQRDEEEARKEAAAARKRAEERRSHEEVREPRRPRSNEAELDRQRKVSEQVDGAARYIHASMVDASDPRPSASRSASTREVRGHDAYDSRSSRRPETVRRSSARPKDRRSSPGRDRDRRGVPEIVEWGSEDRRVPPPFKHSSSSPADIHVPPPRATPQRSQTEVFPEPRLRVDTSPAAMFRRSETMPSIPSSQSYRKAGGVETVLPRQTSGYTSSPLREREREPDVFPTVPAARAVPVAGSTKYYQYQTQAGGVTLLPEHVDVANGHRTILREPGHERRQHRSPSPLSRPPIGPNRPSLVEKSPLRPSVSNSIPPPPLGRSATYLAGEERGRTGKLYGEVDRKRENARRQTSFSPDSVNYAQKIGSDDIRWSAARGAREREKEDERGFVKPSLGRHPTGGATSLS